MPNQQVGLAAKYASAPRAVLGKGKTRTIYVRKLLPSEIADLQRAAGGGLCKDPHVAQRRKEISEFRERLNIGGVDDVADRELELFKG